MNYKSILCFLFLLIFTIPLHAQLRINVSDDMGGYCRPGDWFPIVVSISNQAGESNSAPFEGRIIVESSSISDENGKYQFVRDVSVPVSSNKRYILHAKLPENTAAQFQVTVRRSNGQLIQTIPLDATFLEQSDILALNISSDASRLSLPFLRPNSVGSIRQATRSPQFLPDSWTGYDAADLIIFSEWPTNVLTSTKIDALNDWISMGGTLVLLGGSSTNSYQDEAAPDFLPVNLTGTTTYQYNESLQRFAEIDSTEIGNGDALILSNGTALPGTRTLLEASGGVGAQVPLMVQQDRGKGQIVFIGTDFKDPNRQLRDFLSPYYFSIMPEKNRLDWRHQIIDYMDDKLILITNVRPPSSVIIILICILYTLFVGPINFFVLSKMGKIQLAWVTVPIIVFVFSGLIYGLGSLTKGSDSVARETSLIIGKQGESNYELKSDIGILTAKDRTLKLTPRQEEWSVADHDRWYNHDSVLGHFTTGLGAATGGGLGLGGGGDQVINSLDSGIIVEEWRLKTFNFKRFEVRGPLRKQGTIESSLSYANTNDSFWFEGDLENLTSWDFYDAALLFGKRGYPLGPMLSGDKIALDQQDTIWRLSGTGGVRPNWDSSIDSFLPETLSGIADTDENINRENAATTLEGILNPEKIGRLIPPTQGKLYFVGLAEDPDLTCDIGFNRDKGDRTIIVMVELNPVPSRGTFTVFADFVNVRLLANDSNTPNHSSDFFITDTPRKLEVRNQTSIFSIDLPFRSENLGIVSVVPKIDYQNNSQTQDFNHFAVPYNSGAQTQIFETGVLRNGSGNAWFSAPYNGRMFTIIESKAPRDENGNVKDVGFIQTQNETTIESIGYRISGEIQ